MGNQHLVYERYIWFDAQIRQKRYPNARTLAEEYEISVRTAQRHIDFMRISLHAPLQYVPSRRGYTYETPFSLPNLPLSQAETLAVLLAQGLISATDTGYLSRAIQDLGARIFTHDSELGISQRRLRQRFSVVWHGYETSADPVFNHVVQALLSDHLLEITYRSPWQDEPSQRTIEPHHLQNYMGSWVVLAWCHHRAKWRRFYLSRMEQSAVSPQTFQRKPAATWRHLLHSAFGIFQGEEDDLSHVSIRFDASVARWVQGQVWHPKQDVILHDDGTLTLTLPVADHREITREILKFGPAAEVLEPKELRRRILDEGRRLVATYDGEKK